MNYDSTNKNYFVKVPEGYCRESEPDFPKNPSSPASALEIHPVHEPYSESDVPLEEIEQLGPGGLGKVVDLLFPKDSE